MSITPLPDPPQTSDPTNFAAKADAFIAALPTFVSQLNGLIAGAGGLSAVGDSLIMANITGGVAVPSGVGISALLDHVLGGGVGTLIYRDPGAGWTVLAPGAAGYLLASNGAGAAPSYVAPPAPSALPSIGANKLLANLTGGAAVPTEQTVTAILDALLGSTRGQVMVRGAATWGVLGLGTVRKVLVSDGTDLVYKSQVTWNAAISPVATGRNAYAHALGVPETARVFAYIKCTSTDAGYAVGDTIQISSSQSDTNSNRQIALCNENGGNTASVIIASGISVPHKSTFADTALTLAKWDLYIGIQTGF